MSNLPSPSALRAALLRPGRHAVAYAGGARQQRPVTLHTYRPEGLGDHARVVLVQHGVLRNGDEYRDFWIPAAQEHGLLIIAPTFSNEDWPGVENYNNGALLPPGTTTADTQPSAPAEWSYSVIPQLAAQLQEAGVAAPQRLYLFGHSAGGQFVHRLMSLLLPTQLFAGVAAGNPGWYTLPALDRPFPEGLAGTTATAARLAPLFAYPLTILAGDQDIATDDPHLPAEPAALRQGPHRFARAHHYIATAQAQAAQLGLPLHWQLHPVAGIGHDGQAMSAVCAHLWFHGRMPDACQLAALAGHHTA